MLLTSLINFIVVKKYSKPLKKLLRKMLDGLQTHDDKAAAKRKTFKQLRKDTKLIQWTMKAGSILYALLAIIALTWPLLRRRYAYVHIVLDIFTASNLRGQHTRTPRLGVPEASGPGGDQSKLTESTRTITISAMQSKSRGIVQANQTLKLGSQQERSSPSMGSKTAT